jgi:hypothetical protein
MKLTLITVMSFLRNTYVNFSFNLSKRNPENGLLRTQIFWVIKVLSLVWVTKDGFGLVIGFINNLTTINYYTIADLHNLQSLHANLFSLSALVFTDLSHRNYNSLTELHTPRITHK